MNHTTAMPLPQTYAEVRAWPDETRWELIDGHAYAMAAPSLQHQLVVLGLATQLRTQFRARGCRVVPAPFDVLLADAGRADSQIDTVVQPDIVVVCDAAKLENRGCRGAPELVIEVVSPTSETRDRVVKLALYEQHGVSQVWIVDPIDRSVTVHRRVGDRFAAPESFAAHGVQAIAGDEPLVIDWDEVFADVASG